MEMTTYSHGTPSWADLGTADTDRAAAFYGALFGWTTDDGSPESGGYRMCSLRGLPVAGLGPQMNPGPPMWTVYFTVDDADATAGAVTAAGGHVLMPPMDVLDVGRMAVFADPLGAAFSVWQPRAHKGAGLMDEPGSLCWFELITDDIPAAAAFYTTVFGWGTHGADENPHGYTEVQIGGRSVGGIMQRPAAMPAQVPPYWCPYFAVADAGEAVAKVSELGGSVMVPPTRIEPGTFAVVVDPTGAVFNIIAMAG